MIVRESVATYVIVGAMAVLGSLWAGSVRAAAQTQAQSTPVALTGVLKSYSPGTNEITVTFEGVDRVLQLAAADQGARKLVQVATPGDVLTLNVDDAVEPETATKIVFVQRPVAAAKRLSAFGIAVLLVLGAASVTTRSHPLRFAIGVDNRYSNSQSQLVAWSGALAVVYLATVTLRVWVLGLDFVGGVGITANLAALTGMSALSFGGAKVITASKLDKLALIGGPPTKLAAASPALMTDLFTNDKGTSDLGDFQMIAITLVAVIIFVVTAFNWLHLLTVGPTVTLPDIDSSLLTGFGIGQGAYLVKKAALNLGEG